MPHKIEVSQMQVTNEEDKNEPAMAESKLREHQRLEQERKSMEENKLAVTRTDEMYVYKWLDVLDTENKWLEAHVLQIDTANNILIKYKGYDAKYNEWLDPSSRRVAPLHTHTRPGTFFPRVEMVIGQQLDTLDTVDKWHMSKIIDANRVRQQVKITYLDFPDKYDEWLDMTSYRFAPLHTFTKPKAPKQVSNVHVSAYNEEQFREILQRQYSWKIVDMATDGNCLFRSVSHQLYGSPDHHQIIRDKCIDYIVLHSDFFQGYIDEEFKQYCERMRYLGEWGGEIEIRAMGEMYGRTIEIYAYGAQPRQIYRGREAKYPVRLSYHWNSHYNSILDANEFHAQERFLHTEPGKFEDEQIRLGGRIRDHAPVTEEERAFKHALLQSRREFDNLSLNDTLQKVFISETEEAKRLSQEQDLDKAILESMKAESMLVNDMDADMQRALCQSAVEFESRGAASEIKQAPVHSDKAGIPSPVQEAAKMGFSLDEAQVAYMLFNDTKSTPDAVLQQMIAYLSPSK